MNPTVDAAWSLWGETQGRMRRQFDHAALAPTSAGRAAMWFVLSRVVKGWCLGAGARDPHPVTIPLRTFEQWAREEYGEDLPGFSASSFRRAIVRLEKSGWLAVERRGRKKRRIDYWCLVLTPGAVLRSLMGIAAKVFRRPDFRNVREAVKDLLWHAARYTSQRWNEQYSESGTETRTQTPARRPSAEGGGAGLAAGGWFTPGTRIHSLATGAALEAEAPRSTALLGVADRDDAG